MSNPGSKANLGVFIILGLCFVQFFVRGSSLSRSDENLSGLFASTLRMMKNVLMNYFGETWLCQLCAVGMPFFSRDIEVGQIRWKD